MEALLERLTEYGVDFVLVGGYAAVAHGATLVTQDLDVCFRFAPENLGKLEAALQDLHPIHRMTPQRLPLDLSAPSTSSLKNLYLNTDWGPFDCLGRITGLGNFDEVLARSEELELPWGRIHILTIQALIQAKEAINRPRDQAAVEELRQIMEMQDGS